MDTKYTFIEILHDKWWIAVITLGIALVITPIVRLIAYRLGMVDKPDPDASGLKPHGRPVAYLGGLAMCAAYLSGIGVYIFVMPQAGNHWQALKASITNSRFMEVINNPIWNLCAVGLSGVIITIVGLADDLRNISPRNKVWGQVAAAVMLLAGGVGNRVALVLFNLVSGSINVLGGQSPAWLVSPPAWVVTPLSGVLLILLVIATCNATNLLDGLDGLCGGVTGIIALGFLALAVWLAMWGHKGHQDYDALRVGISLAMAGAVLGFLPYNIPPASIFMGDAGSMLLGFFVAIMMAMFCQEGHARWFLASCAIFALPILDTALAVVRRIRAGRSIFAGDRSHLYDQLVDRGKTVKQVVILFYLLAAAAAALGVLMAIYARIRYALIVYTVLFAAAWVIFYLKGMINPPGQDETVTEKNPEACEND